MTATAARGIPGPRMLRAVISAECKSVFTKNPRIGSPFRRSHEMLSLNSHECGQPDRSARLRPAADDNSGAVPRLGVELRPRTGGLDLPAHTRGRARLARGGSDRD